MEEETCKEKIKRAAYGLARIAGGFTLLEVLVVVAIVGILFGIIFASLNSARQKGRDAQRIGDLYQLRQAIELYLTTNSRLPGSSGPGNCVSVAGCVSADAAPWIPDLTAEYISSVSTDPINSISLRYRYRSSAVGDGYELDAPMESEGQRAENDGGNANICFSSATCRYEVGSDLTRLGDGP